MSDSGASRSDAELTQKFWADASCYPLRAMADPLFPLLVLEDPTRWSDLEAEKGAWWVRNFLHKLQPSDQKRLGLDCAERCLQDFETKTPADSSHRAICGFPFYPEGHPKHLACRRAIKEARRTIIKPGIARPELEIVKRMRPGQVATMRESCPRKCAYFSVFYALELGDHKFNPRFASPLTENVVVAIHWATGAAGYSPCEGKSFYIWVWRRFLTYLNTQKIESSHQ